MSLVFLTYTELIIDPEKTELWIICVNKAFAFNKSKKGDKDQELIQSSTTPKPGYHVGN